MNKQILNNYLSHLESDDDEQIQSAIHEIEQILSDSQSTHLRMLFLESLAAKSESPDDVKPIENPLSSDHLNSLIEKGIIQAHSDGDVTSEQIIRLAHSIDGLYELTDALFEASEESIASTWEKAFTVPFEIPSVDIGKEPSSLKTTSTWSRVASLVNEWMDAAFGKKVPTLGFRGVARVAEKPGVILHKKLTRTDKMVMQLNTLKNMHIKIRDPEIKQIWLFIPWDDITLTLKQDLDWESFLRRAALLINSHLNPHDLFTLTNWIETQERTVEVKLMVILVSTCLMRFR